MRLGLRTGGDDEQDDDDGVVFEYLIELTTEDLVFNLLQTTQWRLFLFYSSEKEAWVDTQFFLKQLYSQGSKIGCRATVSKITPSGFSTTTHRWNSQRT